MQGKGMATQMGQAFYSSFIVLSMFQRNYWPMAGTGMGESYKFSYQSIKRPPPVQQCLYSQLLFARFTGSFHCYLAALAQRSLSNLPHSIPPPPLSPINGFAHMAMRPLPEQSRPFKFHICHHFPSTAHYSRFLFFVNATSIPVSVPLETARG